MQLLLLFAVLWLIPGHVRLELFLKIRTIQPWVPYEAQPRAAGLEIQTLVLVQLLPAVADPAIVQLICSSPEDLPHRCVADEKYLAILVAVGDIRCCVVAYETAWYLPVLERPALGAAAGRVEKLSLVEQLVAMVQVVLV